MASEHIEGKQLFHVCLHINKLQFCRFYLYSIYLDITIMSTGRDLVVSFLGSSYVFRFVFSVSAFFLPCSVVYLDKWPYVINTLTMEVRTMN